MIGFNQARKLTLSHLTPLRSVNVSIDQGTDRVLAGDVSARMNAPSVDASLKDGYAVRAADISAAGDTHPVYLKQKGTVGAGASSKGRIEAGETMRILTGARLPDGADAVVAEEYAQVKENSIVVDTPVEKGFNVLPLGSDVTSGTRILSKGTLLTPGRIGLAAAAGISRLAVFRRPHVWLAATGDEVVLPGSPIQAGQLYASNIMAIDAWCRRYRMTTTLALVQDDRRTLGEALAGALPKHDAIITSGGAWKGDRDFMARVLDDLGCRKIYHRIRLGPGKAVGFGVLLGKPVFILPGGPASNLVAFLTLALPALLRLAGWTDPALPEGRVTMEKAVNGQTDWTQAVFGNLDATSEGLHFVPFKNSNRLHEMYQATALLLVPEGISHLRKGAVVNVSRLD